MRPRLALLALLTLLAALPGRAGTLSVAAAANLTIVLEALQAQFEQQHPGVALRLTVGASGSLAAQVRHGAPFDVFLSADTSYPGELAHGGFADPATLRTFAIGRLALWTTRTDLDLGDLKSVVRHPSVRKLAIAQPELAPYGRAAAAALAELGVSADAKPKLVIGENIAQTAQFVDTGNADAGFVALSFLVKGRLARRGRYAEIPPALYRSVSLAHAAVLTSRGSKNPEARLFLEFLQTPAARRVLQEHGYSVP